MVIITCCSQLYSFSSPRIIDIKEYIYSKYESHKRTLLEPALEIAEEALACTEYVINPRGEYVVSLNYYANEK